MAVISYETYTEDYGGDLTEAAFSSALPAATRHVAWLCDGKEPADDAEATAYMRAVCAAVEAFAAFGEGQVGGFTLGSFKMTNYEDEATTGEELASEAACKELLGTSLIFSGVR